MNIYCNKKWVRFLIHFFNEKVLRWGSKGPKGGAFIFT